MFTINYRSEDREKLGDCQAYMNKCMAGEGGEFPEGIEMTEIDDSENKKSFKVHLAPEVSVCNGMSTIDLDSLPCGFIKLSEGETKTEEDKE